MSAIAGEHIQTASASVLTKARLKWLAYVTLGGLISFVSARYGYEYWSVGRFIESTDDAYAGGNVTPISPHVAGFVRGDLRWRQRICARRTAADPSRRPRFPRRRRPRGGDCRGAQGDPRQPRAQTDTATNGHPPGEGGSRRQDRAAAFAEQDDQGYRDLAQPRPDRGKMPSARRRSDLSAEASVASSAAGLDAAKNS